MRLLSFSLRFSLTLFYESLFVGDPLLDESLSLFFRIGWAGYVIYLLFLVGAVLILMNLEKTFRHSVGHTRWQVKFMVLGIGRHLRAQFIPIVRLSFSGW